VLIRVYPWLKRLFQNHAEPGYLRDPRLTFFSFVCRIFVFLRDGLLMMKVPLPTYSAL
jgi:hypothetical protein